MLAASLRPRLDDLGSAAARPRLRTQSSRMHEPRTLRQSSRRQHRHRPRRTSRRAPPIQSRSSYLASGIRRAAPSRLMYPRRMQLLIADRIGTSTLSTRFCRSIPKRARASSNASRIGQGRHVRPNRSGATVPSSRNRATPRHTSPRTDDTTEHVASSVSLASHFPAESPRLNASPILAI